MNTFYCFQVEFKERTIQQFADYIFDFFFSIKTIEKNTFDKICYIYSKERNWIIIDDNIENRIVLAQQLLAHLKKELKTYENIHNPTVDTMLENIQMATFQTQIAGVLTYINLNFSKVSLCNINFDVREVNWSFDFYKKLFQKIVSSTTPQYAYLIPRNLIRIMNYVDLPRNLYTVGWINYFSNVLNLDSELKFANQESFHEGFIIASVLDVFDETNPLHIESAKKMFDFFENNGITKSLNI